MRIKWPLIDASVSQGSNPEQSRVQILSTKSGCPEHTALGTHVPKRASAATQSIPMALPGKGRIVLALLLATSLLAQPGG